MAFFGSGGLGNLSGASSQPSLDPQLVKALLAQFPGLEGLEADAQSQQPPRSLQTLGYQGQGPQLFQGQGVGNFQLSPFESASGVSPESITSGLAQGSFGKSGSQSPLGPAPQQSSLLSLPSLQLPMAQAAAIQGGYGDAGGGETVGAPTEDGGISIGLGDVIGGAKTVAGLFSPGTGTAFDPGQQTQDPAYQQQRAGERDLSTLGGSFQNPLAPPSAAPLSGFVGVDPATTTFEMAGPGTLAPTTAQPFPMAPGTTFSMPTRDLTTLGGSFLSPPSSLSNFITPDGTLAPGTTFEMPGAGTTMNAPGGSAQTALGSSTPSLAELTSTLLGGLGGALGVYSGIQGLQQGDVTSGVLGIGSGALTGYSALQSLSQAYPQLFGGNTLPQLSQLALKGIEAISPATAQAVREGLSAVSSAANAAPGGISGLSGVDYTNLVGLALAAASPFIKQDQDSAALQKGASTALTLASMMLSQTGYGAAVAAAINSALKIYEGISQNKSPEEITSQAIFAGTPVGMLDLGGNISQHISEAFMPSAAWRNFVPELFQNVGQQNTAFSVLSQSLPYVQSKEELGQLLNTYKNYLGTTTGITPEQYGGTGLGDPYSIGKIPGVGPVTHGEQTQTVDWGATTQTLQKLVDDLLGVLPGERISAQYGQPGGSLEGENAMRLWTQFLDREQNAPIWVQGATPDQRAYAETLGVQDGRNLGEEYLAGLKGYWAGNQYGQDVTGSGNPALTYGMPGYDYAGAGFPEPGKYLGSQSPFWDQLIQQYAAPVVDPLVQYREQIQQLMQQSPDILAAAQQSVQGAPVAGMMPQPAMAGTSAPAGNTGGIDLYALLKQLGYVAA